MTYSVLFRQHHRKLASSVVAVTGVTVLECEPRDLRSRRAPSPRRFSNGQVHQQLQAAAPAQTTGRRIGAGAGATPVFVALIRHDTTLVRCLSLVGRSRTCPFFVANLIANRNATRIRNEFRIRRRHNGNGHS
jgi:hypothetical protein